MVGANGSGGLIGLWFSKSEMSMDIIKDGEEVKVCMKVLFAVDGSCNRFGGLCCNK